MRAKPPTLPINVIVAAIIAFGTIYLQLLIFNAILFEFASIELLFVYSLLIACGLSFALFCQYLCRLISDRVTQVPGWLTALLKSLARKFNLPIPEIHLLNMPGLNAFALQGISRRGHILLQTSVLTQLNQDEVEAVLAHEYSHLASHHAFMLTVVQGMILPLTIPIASITTLFYAFIYGLDKFRGVFLTLHQVMTALLFPLTSICIALFTRGWEFAADRQAAQVIGMEKYIAALTCLHGSFFQHPNLLNISTEANGQARQQGWALSHPSLAQRINALREIGQS